MTSAPTAPPPPITLVLDPHDDAVHTHTALAAHNPSAGRITLHPSPGTTGDTCLAHDLLAALGKPPLLPGAFPSGRQPAWEAAAAWIHAAPVTHLVVLRAHRLTPRRLARLLRLRDLTALHLTLVCHRPHLPAALRDTLSPLAPTLIRDPADAHRHYHGNLIAPPTPPIPIGTNTRPSRRRWITLPTLDRLVSFDPAAPCGCTPPPVHPRRRRPPLTPATARETDHRIRTTTAHPRLAAALAATVFTGASFQQLATARTTDIDDHGTTLALHDPHRYTDGCATHSVPPWARELLRAAAHFAATATGDRRLLAHPDDRPTLLRLAEAAKLRPPQPPAIRRTGPLPGIEWDWRERREAERHGALLAAHRRRHFPPPAG